METMLSSTDQRTSAVFVVGDTGSGKSTFINFMVGAPLVMKKEEKLNRYMIENAEADPQLPIGHGMKSKTKIPTIYKDKENRVWVDTPGF